MITGISLVVLAAILQGIFMLPMRGCGIGNGSTSG